MNIVEQSHNCYVNKQTNKQTIGISVLGIYQGTFNAIVAAGMTVAMVSPSMV